MPMCGGHLDGAADHVAGAGHDELDVVHDLEDFLGGGEEIFGAFLHGDAAEEEDDLFVLVNLVFLFVERAVAVGLDGVVDDFDLVGIDAVVVGDDVLGEVADGDDLDGGVHAAAFDVVDAGVDVRAGAVEFGGVDVNDQGLALEGGDGHAGGEGHPVVGVDDVEGFVARDFGGEGGVALDFVEEVSAVMFTGAWAGAFAGGFLAGVLDDVVFVPGELGGAGVAGGFEGVFVVLGGLIGIADGGVDGAEGDALELIEAEFGGGRGER